LPIEQPERFELAVNLSTGGAFCLNLPPVIVFRADDVID
jgi:hypothetical protein